MARKALATIGTGAMRPVLDQSLHTFRRFGERHGYDVVVGGEEAIEDRAPAWNKVLLLRSLLESYDYVLWIDADAIILDDSVDPVSLLGDGHYQALVRYRWNEEECACTGVWLLRNVEKASRLSRRSLEWRRGVSAPSSLGAGRSHEVARIQCRSRSICCSDRMDERHSVARERVGHHSGLHTRASPGAMQDPPLCARNESGSPPTDAHGSPHHGCSLCNEFSGSYVAPPCILGRFNAVEPWLPAQAGGVRSGATDWSRPSSARARLWRPGQCTDTPGVTACSVHP